MNNKVINLIDKNYSKNVRLHFLAEIQQFFTF